MYDRNLYIIYLGFDGVLHDDAVHWNPKGGGLFVDRPNRTLFEWAPILLDMLALYPTVKIVLSTSWTHVRNFEFAIMHMPPSLASRVIGDTFGTARMLQSEFEILPRGQQVAIDVGYRCPTGWFAIDNDDLGWGAARGSLVKTEDRTGISTDAAQAAIRAMLQAFQRKENLL